MASTRRAAANQPLSPMAGQQQQQQPPPPPPVFALSPALAVQGVIDYSSRFGGKLYEQATYKLADELYDAKPDGMRQFLTSFKDRARASAWIQTLTIQQGQESLYLPDHYGTLTVDSIKAHVLNYTGQISRHAQNSEQIYQCLANSLTPTAKNSVQTKSELYTINDAPDGLLYFKAITQTIQVDTRATSANIKAKLMSLDTLMLECNQDVQAFNEQVVALKEKLLARGEPVTDLLHNLWRGYQACTDKEFSAYISRRKSDWKHGEDITPDDLMHQTNNEYQSLVDDGVWLEPTAAEKQVIALVAKLEAQQKQFNKQQNKSNNKNGKGKGKKQGNKEGNKSDGKNKYPDWKKQAPTGSESTTKKVKNKTYYWCPHHKLWTAHKGSECKLGDSNSTSSSKKTKSTSSSSSAASTGTPGSVTVSRSLMAIMEDDE
jgi:hypothetical protein